MTEEQRAGAAPSAAPTDSIQEPTDGIGRTREELGETAGALAARPT